jgi:hypothetical protein
MKGGNNKRASSWSAILSSVKATGLLTGSWELHENVDPINGQWVLPIIGHRTPSLYVVFIRFEFELAKLFVSETLEMLINLDAHGKASHNELECAYVQKKRESARCVV